MHHIYEPEEEDWSVFLSNDLQIGGGSNEEYFVGFPYQRGGGLGDVLRGLWRFLLPYGKSVGKTLGDEGLHAASNILSEVVHNNADFKSTAKKEIKKRVGKLLRKAGNAVDEQEGGSKRFKLKALGGPALKNKIARDIFA